MFASNVYSIKMQHQGCDVGCGLCPTNLLLIDVTI